MGVVFEFFFGRGGFDGAGVILGLCLDDTSGKTPQCRIYPSMRTEGSYKSQHPPQPTFVGVDYIYLSRLP